MLNITELVNMMKEEGLSEYEEIMMDLIIKQHNYKLSHLKDGRYQIYYKFEGMRKRKAIYGKTKAGVGDKLFEVYENYKNGKLQLTDKTFAEVYREEWLPQKEANADSENTIVRTEQIYKKYIKDTQLDKMFVNQINTLFLEDFLNQMIKNNNMTAKLYTNVKTIIKGVLSYCYKHKYINIDPMQGVEIKRKFLQKNVKRDDQETFSDEEIKNLFSFLDDCYRAEKDASFMAIKVNFFLGLRIGELCSLKWSDLYEKNGIDFLRIQREEVRNQKSNTVSIVEHTKTREVRDVNVPEKARMIFENLRKKRDLKNEFIFVRLGERLTARQMVLY